jgi:hypothetical protein
MYVVIIKVVSIYIMKRALSHSIGSNAQTVASFVNALQITVFNIIYSYIATALTDRENHRTDTEYEDSMISKLFLFQVIITVCLLHVFHVHMFIYISSNVFILFIRTFSPFVFSLSTPIPLSFTSHLLHNIFLHLGMHKLTSREIVVQLIV